MLCDPKVIDDLLAQEDEEELKDLDETVSGGEELQLQALEEADIAHGASTFHGHFTVGTRHGQLIN